MRNRILTEVEKKAIRAFLRDKKKTRHVRVTMTRVRRQIQTLQTDLELLRQFKDNYESEST